jgi:hypothetical protein
MAHKEINQSAMTTKVIALCSGMIFFGERRPAPDAGQLLRSSVEARLPWLNKGAALLGLFEALRPPQLNYPPRVKTDQPFPGCYLA